MLTDEQILTSLVSASEAEDNLRAALDVLARLNSARERLAALEAEVVVAQQEVTAAQAALPAPVRTALEALAAGGLVSIP